MNEALIVLSGCERGKEYPLEDVDIRIGRHRKSTIPLESARVSRHHALVYWTGEHYALRDLRSLNGTYVNGLRIASRPLNHGDTISIGNVQFRYRAQAQSVTISEPALMTRRFGGKDDTVKDVHAGDTHPELRDDTVLEASYQASLAFNEPMDPDEIVEPLIELARGALPFADTLSLHLADHGRGILRCRQVWDRNGLRSADRLPFSRTLIRTVIKEREPVLIRDVEIDGPRSPVQTLHDLSLQSAIAVPVMTHREIFGVIQAGTSGGAREFDESDLRLLATIGRQAGAALARARERDELQRARADRRRARVELKETQELVHHSSSLAAVGQLSAGMVHDLRAPMTVIKGYADLVHGELSSLLGDRYAGSELRRNLASIDKAVNHCDLILEELLQFSKPADTSRRVLGTIDALVDDALDLLRTEFMMRNIRIGKAFGAELPPVRYDSGQVRRVLINLLMNAVQAMGEGGRLEVRTSNRKQDGANLAAISISDNGCGLTPEQQQRIFDPFVTNRRSGSGQGTGLGLTVCQHIIKNHGGKIEVNSEPGRGTTFTVLLPGA